MTTKSIPLTIASSIRIFAHPLSPSELERVNGVHRGKTHCLQLQFKYKNKTYHCGELFNPKMENLPIELITLFQSLVMMMVRTLEKVSDIKVS